MDAVSIWASHFVILLEVRCDGAIVLAGIQEASRLEPILAGSSGVGPDIRLGVGLEEAFPGPESSRQNEAVAMQQAYAGQQYALVWRQGKGSALLSESFPPKDVLRILWQVHAQVLYKQNLV